MNTVPVRVALTFDAEHPDHPVAAADGCTRILDTLAATGTPATFFVQGRWALSRPDEARRIATDGHLVGLHCNSHVPYPLLSADGVAADIENGRNAVREACGVDPAPWFRFPYGRGADDPALLNRVRDLGFTNVHWSVDPHDWCNCAEPQRLVEALDRAITAAETRADGTPLVVLHHTWPPATDAALPVLVDLIRRRAAEAVTVDRLEPAAVVGLPYITGLSQRCTCD